jgi:hypothetical protein
MMGFELRSFHRAPAVGSLLSAVACIAFAPAANAQAVFDLTPGQTRARPAAASRQPEMFRFLGEPGQTVRITAVARGAIEGQLFEPQGSPMLDLKGEGEATLEAILPADGVFLFSVVRASPEHPYSVTLKVRTPDPYFAAFTEGVGYTLNLPGQPVPVVSCWLEPGRTFKVINVGVATTVVTLWPGSKRSFHQTGNGRSEDFESDTRFEGDDWVTTYRGLSQGEVIDRRLVLERQGVWTYSGYKC